jgi:cytochrome c oxidase subunit 1
VIPLIFRKQVSLMGLARWQPYLFGIGIVTVSMSMIFLGILGVPRRHWDISFANAPFKQEFSPLTDLFMATLGIGGLLAATGALIFIAVAVLSVFVGRRLTEEDIRRGVAAVPQGILRLPPQQHGEAEGEAAHRAGTPGTLVLVAIFLTVFVFYYFTNWKVLSLVWKIG